MLIILISINMFKLTLLLQKGNKVLKKISILIVVAFMTLGSGCSTYNSFVPDWASIGSSASDTKSSDKNNDSSDWWNPFSWF